MESDMRTTALCNLVADDATYVHAHWLPSYGCASADTIDTFHSTFTQQSHYNHT